MSNTFTLYSFANYDRSSRVRWLLAELDLPLEEKRLDYQSQQHKSADYLAINPFGLVPGANFFGKPVFESGAILQLILEKHPDSTLWAAPNSTERAQFLSWFQFAVSTLENRVMSLYFYKRTPENAEKRKEAFAKLEPLLTTLQNFLSDKTHVVANRFTVVDIVVAHCLSLLRRDEVLNDFPGLNQYLDTMAKRPAAGMSGMFEGMKA